MNALKSFSAKPSPIKTTPAGSDGRPPVGSALWRRRLAARLLASLSKVDGLGGMMLAALLALGFACWMYSPDYLLGTAPTWQQQGGDVSQYLAGFNAFVREPWHWPLFRIESLNYPEGTIVTFVDAIPLYAALIKLFHGSDAGFWNPYGFWVGLCYVLQGVGCWWICREAQVRSWTALAALALLLAAFPALTHRAGHISLMSQWLLLFAFAIYLRGTRRQALASACWIGLLFCAFYINIYIFCMTTAIFLADIARHIKPGHSGRALLTVAGAGGLLGASLFLTMLPLGGSAGAREWGFGYYSMNLLSPFAGGRLILWPHPTVHGGQGEGFNYIGVFALGLFAWALCLQKRHAPVFWARHRFLLLAIALMALYAPSNLVHVGEVRLFDWGLPEWTLPITSQLRASGRFFWPAGYAVIVFAVIMAQRYGKARWAALVLSAVVVLQFWDLKAQHLQTRAIAHQAAPVLLDEAKWDAFLGADTRTLHFYPVFRCGKGAANETLLPAMLYASKRKLNMTTGYLSRVARPCELLEKEVANAKAPGDAFVFARNEFPDLAGVQARLGGEQAAQCIETGAFFLCKRRH
jgi:hypothetical protein